MRKKANRKLLFASVIFCFFGTHLKCVLCLFYSVIHFHLAQPKSEDKRQSTTPSDGVWCIPVVRVRCVHVNTYLLQDGICTCKLRCFSLTKWSKWNQMQSQPRERERKNRKNNKYTPSLAYNSRYIRTLNACKIWSWAISHTLDIVKNIRKFNNKYAGC